nr:MAG TPA: hypothetical protein [Caudoviricetes sp.]
MAAEQAAARFCRAAAPKGMDGQIYILYTRTHAFFGWLLRG